jgi:hypothetical protein
MALRRGLAPSERTNAGIYPLVAREMARVTRAIWPRFRFAPKSAPQHRDFGAGKVGLI